MYDFESAEDLAQKNMPKLKRMMSEDVFDYLSINNPENLKQNYYKFMNYRTSVNIIENTAWLFEGRVLYSFQNQEISPSREFMFIYTQNLFGKITKIRMYEVIRLSP